MQAGAQSVVPLHGATPETLARGLEEDEVGTFEVSTYFPTIADRPLLFIGAERGNGARVQQQVIAAKTAGAKRVTEHTWPTSHAFDDHRFKLTVTVVDWLRQFTR